MCVYIFVLIYLMVVVTSGFYTTEAVLEDGGGLPIYRYPLSIPQVNVWQVDICPSLVIACQWQEATRKHGITALLRHTRLIVSSPPTLFVLWDISYACMFTKLTRLLLDQHLRHVYRSNNRYFANYCVNMCKGADWLRLNCQCNLIILMLWGFWSLKPPVGL